MAKFTHIKNPAPITKELRTDGSPAYCGKVTKIHVDVALYFQLSIDPAAVAEFGFCPKCVTLVEKSA
jgi:hypothetical protein